MAYKGYNPGKGKGVNPMSIERKKAEDKFPGWKALDSKNTPGSFSMTKGGRSFTYKPGKLK